MVVTMSVDHSLKNNGISIFEDDVLVYTENLDLKTDGDYRFVEFRTKVNNLLTFYKPNVVVLEKTAHLRNANILRSLIGLYMIALEVSVRSGAIVRTVNPKSVKKFITGSGSASKDEVMYTLINKYKIDKEKIFFPIYYKKNVCLVKEYLYDVSDSVANALYVIKGGDC